MYQRIFVRSMVGFVKDGAAACFLMGDGWWWVTDQALLSSPLPLLLKSKNQKCLDATCMMQLSSQDVLLCSNRCRQARYYLYVLALKT